MKLQPRSSSDTTHYKPTPSAPPAGSHPRRPRLSRARHDGLSAAGDVLVLLLLSVAVVALVLVVAVGPLLLREERGRGTVRRHRIPRPAELQPEADPSDLHVVQRDMIAPRFA